MTDPGDRRESRRERYSAMAIAFVGNKQFTCRIADISQTGVLLYAPVEQPPGAFMRLNLCLPAVSEVIDVDGVLVRVTAIKDHPAWGIKFFEPSPEVPALIGGFLTWLEHQKTRVGLGGDTKLTVSIPPSPAEEIMARSATGPHLPVGGPRSARPPSGERASVTSPPASASPPERRPASVSPPERRPATGPHFPRVGSGEFSSTEQSNDRRLKAEIEARWKAREEAIRASKELRKIYKDALKDIKKED